MKKLLINIVVSIFVVAIIESLIVMVQYFYQVSQEDVSFIYLGFPFEFYYFQYDYEIHGLILEHFIYDAFLLFVFSFLIVHIWMKVRNKRKKLPENIRIDEPI